MSAQFIVTAVVEAVDGGPLDLTVHRVDLTLVPRLVHVVDGHMVFTYQWSHCREKRRELYKERHLPHFNFGSLGQIEMR